MKVMPPPAKTYAGAPPQVTRVNASLTERVRRTGFSVTPARSEPPAPPMNMTVESADSQFSWMRSNRRRKAPGNSALDGPHPLVEPIEAVVFSRRGDHQHGEARPRFLRV